MPKAAGIFWGEVHEDGPFSVLNRVTSLSGTGSEVQRGEGNLILQADVASITCKVFELASFDADAGAEVTPAPTLTAAANVYDALQTAGWAADEHGWNFRLDVGAAYLADPDEWRLIEIRIVLDGGEVIWIEWRVKTLPKGTS